MVKNFNKLTNKYRFWKWDIRTPNNKSIDYVDYQIRKEFIKNKHIIGDKVLQPYDYEPYFLYQFIWLLREFYNSIIPKKTTNIEGNRHRTIIKLTWIMIILTILGLIIVFIQ